MDVRPDPSVTLQQHLQSCHDTLNSALQQTMVQAQEHINLVVKQTLLSALSDIPALLAARLPMTPPAAPP
eukprot:3249895-Prorocentrum_lima.AAC.1